MPSKKANISLAGWLFADLALVLFLIFLPSDVSREVPPTTTTTTTTTTTNPDAKPQEQGVVPKPIEILVNISGDSPTQNQVILALEAALEINNVSPDIKFGVIQVLAGIRGEDSLENRDSASNRASVVAKLLEKTASTDLSSQSRLKSWLYTLSGSDKKVQYPIMKMRLFPDNE